MFNQFIRKRNLLNVIFCDNSFSHNNDMKKHVQSVHEKKKPFKCDICDYSCSNKNVLKKHVTAVHDEKQPFKFEICDKCFAHISNMFMSKSSHSNVMFAETVFLILGT